MPDLSTTMARIEASVDVAATCGCGSECDLVARVISGLRFDDTGNIGTVVLQALCGTRRPHGPDAATLTATWAAIPEPFGPEGTPSTWVPVNAQVGRLNSRGWDGHALFEAAVRSEAARHTGLVWQQANKHAEWMRTTAEDLFGWGWMGLCAALRFYDPSKGNAFSTYAATRITGAMRDGVRAENPVPKRLLTFANKARTATAELQKALGRPPTIDEVAARLEVAVEYLEVLPRLTPAASIDEMTSVGQEAHDDLEGAFAGRTDDTGTVETAAAASVLRADIAEALGRLDPQVAEVIRIVVLEDRSLAECRRLTGMSARKVHEHLDRGYSALADSLASWAPVAA